MLYAKKKKVQKWTKAKQNPLCILKEICVKKKKKMPASFEALKISVTSSCLLVAAFWHLCDKMKAVEHNFNLWRMNFSLSRLFLLWNIGLMSVYQGSTLVQLLRFIQFRETKRNKREVELTQGNYTDVQMTASECLVWNFSSRFMQILRGWSILKWLALHIVKPLPCSHGNDSEAPLSSHPLYLGNRSAAGF